MGDGSGDVLLASLHRPDDAGQNARRPLVLLIHGLAGSADSIHVRASARHLLQQGFPVLRLNLRGAGPSRASCRQNYHAGRSADLEAVLGRMDGQLAGNGLCLVGFSLGGSLLLKYLGELGRRAPVLAAASVSAPIDLAAAQRRLMQRRNRAYHDFMLAGMKEGLLAAPGLEGADIVVGEGQPLGLGLNFGGPLVGFFACRREHLRRMPGRLVGATTDAEGRRGYTLTLQTREQHIRREKATSNICTNVALVALGATIYLALMGKEGLRKAATLSTARAHYAADVLARVPGVTRRFDAQFFKEFVLRLPKSPDRILRALRKRKILGGVPLGQFEKSLKDCLLVAVTESRTRAEIDQYAAALSEVVA